MAEVRKASDGVMTLVVISKKDVLRLISGYAPQSFEEEQSL